MAGGPRNGTIGVGSVLRKAREIRGCSIDEAARDTRLRPDQLRALEEEDFDALLGDVYVRACLRTYSGYLGVDPDEVVGNYARHADDPAPPPPPAAADRVARALAATRLRDSPRVVLLGTAVILIALIAFGVLSSGHGTPEPAPLDTTVVTPGGVDHPIDAALEAKRDVTVTVTVDGQAQTFAMKADETRSFVAGQSLTIDVADGASVHVIVNGNDLGVPGTAGTAWSRTWTAGTGGSPSPIA